MRFRFKKFPYFGYNHRYRFSITRILFLFIITTIFFTAYLYGLIEINSHKVVINILPDEGTQGVENVQKLPHTNKIVNDNDNDYLNENSDKIIIQIDDDSKIESKKSKISTSRRIDINNDHLRPVNYKNKILNEDIYKIEPDKNISRLFFNIERFGFQIKKQLKQSEIDNLIVLKKKYETVLSERNEKIKSELKKELELNENEENKQDQNNENNKKNADDATGNEDNFNIQLTQLSENESITREMLVKLLQLEKYKLRQKLTAKEEIKSIKQLAENFKIKNEIDLSDLPDVWHKYFFKINEFQLYNDTAVVDNILKSMSTQPVISCNEKEKGTQIKLILVLADGTDVLVKPMKVPRDYETPPDHFYFVDFERHHAEIAAFHVDKLLGFYRVPPTVGRVFNMSADLWQKADSDLAKTFYYSPAGNICFTGHCSYYCDTTHAICGKPFDRMEGSVQLMLPNKPLVTWGVVSHPYRRTYNKRKKAEWEINDNYCTEKIFQDITYHSKLMLDLIDMSIFDFFTGNMDRHHYERMVSLGNETFSIHLDNGRAFGRANQDEMSILLPLTQCCLMRYSTYLRLKYLYKNNFSKLLDESLKSDPLYPVLTSSHLKAMNRRLKVIFHELIKCTDKYLPNQVLVDDGY